MDTLNPAFRRRSEMIRDHGRRLLRGVPSAGRRLVRVRSGRDGACIADDLGVERGTLAAGSTCSGPAGRPPLMARRPAAPSSPPVPRPARCRRRAVRRGRWRARRPSSESRPAGRVAELEAGAPSSRPSARSCARRRSFSPGRRTGEPLQFVADHRDAFEVKRLCELVEVDAPRSTPGSRPPRSCGQGGRGRSWPSGSGPSTPRTHVGAPRATAEVDDGVPADERVNHKRVARVMREHGIRGYPKRRRVRTTIPEPSAEGSGPARAGLHRAGPEPALRRRHHLPAARRRQQPVPGHRDSTAPAAARRLAVADHMRTSLVEDASRPPPRPGVASPARSSTATTGRSTPPRTTPGCAPSGDPVHGRRRSMPITRSRRRSTRR